MTLICERCKREVYKNEKCNYCNRKICYSCVKSSQKASKTVKLVICKDCWGNSKKRNAFKNRKGEVVKAVEA